jgi:hypothetical protein
MEPQKWRTIHYAIGDTRRTIRLCAVLLALSVGTIGSAALILLMALAHGWLG